MSKAAAYCRDWERERLEETLTLREAAEESGYSYHHLSRLVTAGQIPNAGVPGSPLIRRADMPKRPATVAAG